MLMLTVVHADLVELERELHGLEQLRERIVESLLSGLQGPRQRQLLRIKLSELNESIASVRRTLSAATAGPFYPIAGASDDCSNSALT
jgi:uncharacterized protein involved in exopolysaccharide biosynthesis